MQAALLDMTMPLATTTLNQLGEHIRCAGRFSGNVSWYAETVKLDLEARKIVERTSSRPQKYRPEIWLRALMARLEPNKKGRSELMKYMLLVHHDEEAFRKRSETERQHMLQESVQLANELHASGEYLGAAPLHPTSETSCVRVRNGKRLVTDGPFAETREQIGGYFLIEAKDLNEAIDIAARIPGARIGTVEVRPVTEVAGLPRL